MIYLYSRNDRFTICFTTYISPEVIRFAGLDGWAFESIFGETTRDCTASRVKEPKTYKFFRDNHKKVLI